MKVLTVSKYDLEGGAAIAALRTHKALKEFGIDSSMMVHKKLSHDPLITGPGTKLNKLKEAISNNIDQVPANLYRNRSSYLFSPGWFSTGIVRKEIDVMRPDIVHVHWSCKGMLSLKDINKIKIPMVFTLHDSWLFTGGCHIPFDCTKFQTCCSKCPTLSSNLKNDLSKIMFYKKNEIFSKKEKIKFVAVSNWMKDSAQSSKVLFQHDIVTIPNPIDTNAFAPTCKRTARDVLGLKSSEPIILFGALSATSDRNKGFLELCAALSKLKTEKCSIIIFGDHGSSDLIARLPKRHHTRFLGVLRDNLSLRLVYSAADVMVVPSRIESFGQTAVEAMSCGTPVVAFDTSGLKDIVDHKQSGYLAKCYETDDLATGIDWTIKNSEQFFLAENARKNVIERFSMDRVAKKLLSVYNSFY